MSRQGIRARSSRGPPKLRQATLFCPLTCSMIMGLRVSAPRSKIEKRARMHASACQSVGSLRAKTAVRLEMETKSSRSILINKLLLCLVPSVFLGQRPRTSMVKMTYSSCDIAQMCPRLPTPAGILWIPVFSVAVTLFSQESQFLFRRNFFKTSSGNLSVWALRRKLRMISIC
jgi:hypothetical protein